MDGNLHDLAKAYLTPDVIERAGALVGESPPLARRALDIALPTITAGLAGDAPNATQSARVLGILDDAGLKGPASGITERLASGSGEDLVHLGKGLLDRIFGDRAAGVVDNVASASGVKRSSMSSLMALATPLVLAVLGREVHGKGLDVAGVGRLLAQQKTTAEMALPRSVVSAIHGDTAARAAPRAEPTRQPASPSRAWAWLLLIPAFILGALLFRNRGAPPTTRETAPREAAPRPGMGVGLPPERTPPKARPPATGEVDLTLPNGERVTLAPGSIGHDLAVFLATPDAETPKRFLFEGLAFDHASGRLTPGANQTIDQVAAVLTAYPAAQVLVEGHTDDSGDPAGNVALSQRRADVVKGALVARGVSADRIATAGAGQDKPIAANDTEEGRAKNRRTEIVVTSR